MMKKEEADLLRRVQQGEEAALQAAIGSYTPYLSTVLYRFAGERLSKQDTEEILSDTFLALWRSAGRIDMEKGTLRAYLAAVAKNFARKRLDAMREELSLDAPEFGEAGLAAPEDEAGRLVTEEALWSAVMRLGEPEGELFVRYYRYGQPLREIAGATGLNLSTVKSKLARGKQKLRKILS